MILYLLDRQGRLAGTCDIAPSAPMPVLSTLDEPPSAQDGKALLYLGNCWHVFDAGQEPGPPKVIVPPRPLRYLHLSRNQLLDLAIAATSLTDDDFVALKAIPAMAAWWMRFEQSEGIACPLDTTDPAGADKTNRGLTALTQVPKGGGFYLSAAEKQAMIDSWPRELA